MIRVLSLWAVLTGSRFLLGQESGSLSAPLLTLDQAIEQALRNNRPVRMAMLEVQKSQEQVALTRMNRLPVFKLDVAAAQLFTPLDFGFPRGIWGVYTATGPIPGRNISVRTPRHPVALVSASAIQPLSQMGRISLGVRLRESMLAETRQHLETQRINLSNSVKKVYFALQQTQSALEAVEVNLKLYRELDRVVGEDVSQQVALRSESMDVKTQLARLGHQAVSLRQDLVTQQEQMNTLLSRDAQVSFRVEPVPEALPPSADLSEVRARALQQRPETRQARLKIEQAELDWKIKKSELLPEVSLAFNYMSPFGVEVLPKNIAMGGFALTWDIFDWGRKKRELSIKSLTIQQARTGLEETESQILVDVNNRYRKVEDARSLLSVLQLAQDAAREKARVAANRYEQRAALLKDVLQAQSLLAETNRQYQQALLAYWTARADFDKAVGER